MAELVGLAMPGGPAFVDALRRTWDDGDAALPIDPRLPGPARDRLVIEMAPGVIIDDSADRRSIAGGRPVEAGDALVVATSGTSGEPKGVVLTHAAVDASARATSARLQVDPDRDRWLACLPLSHVGGLSVVTRALVTGTPLEVLPRFDTDKVMAAARAGATLVSLVATALARIDPGAFRTVLLGGARPPAAVPGNVVSTYGMTETGSGIVYDGRPLDGAEVRLDGAGVIEVRGPMLLRAYRDGTEPTDQDGWFSTGDVGRWAGDQLVVDGRRDDLIISGGENVWPGPVEAVLGVRSDIIEVAVTGRDDREWGQRVVAHLVVTDPAAPPSLDDLRTTVTEQLPLWHAPKEIVLHTALPRLGSGKISRADLR